jgi:hypothetical protein
MDRTERVYGWLLRAYPSSFRSDYEAQMRTVFRDQLRDARASDGTGTVPAVVTRAVVDVLATAPVQHLRKERLVSQPVEPAAVAVGRTARRSRFFVALTALPFVLWAFLAVAASGFMDPIYANPPAIAGLPVGIVILGGAFLLAGLGVLVADRTRSDLVAILAFLFLSCPAMAVIILASPIVLAVQNLAV